MQANEVLEDHEAAIEEIEGEFGPLSISKLEVSQRLPRILVLCHCIRSAELVQLM